MALIWKKHLSVGNAMLDSEHKNLIGIVNSMEYAIKTRNSFALLGTIIQFKDCLHIHFANESRLVQAFDFPFDQHDMSHQHLLKELQHTKNDLEAKVGLWPEYVMDHYPQFLMDWLVGHIIQEDMLMKPLLESYPYDFKPA